MELYLKNSNPVTLHTENKICKEDIIIQPETEELTIIPSAEEQISEGLYNKITVIGDNNLTPENIIKDKVIFGVTGSTEILDTSDATATADVILTGKTAYVNGEKITGTVEDARTSTIGSSSTTLRDNKYAETIGVDMKWLGNKMISNKTTVTMLINYSDLVNKIGLTPEQIVKGNTVLGVEGIVNVSNAKDNKVFFIDYDGTILYSYTLEEIQLLNELPPLPQRDGLICQGWNWDLENIKEMNVPMNIGANYITDDGKTRLYINIPTNYRLNINLCFRQTVSRGIEVDWGDGSNIETFEGEYSKFIMPSHQYSKKGNYIITLNPIESCELTLGGNSSNYNVMGSTSSSNTFSSTSLLRVEIGKNVLSIKDYAFSYCYSLEYITIPKEINGIANYAMLNCNSLKSIIIPKSVLTFGSGTFQYCNSIKKVSLPISMTTFRDSIFYGCNSLEDIIIPNGITQLNGSSFKECYSLKTIIIPEGLTSIFGSDFYNCNALKKVIIPKGVTSIGNQTFDTCYSLENIIIPETVTQIKDRCFYRCRSLKEIILPQTLTQIGANMFYECRSLKNITIPATVTNIGTNAFGNCKSMIEILILGNINSIAADAFYSCSSLKKLDFSNNTQVPSLANTGTFSNTPNDLIIIVPDNLYDEWISATNWSNYANKIFKVSEVQI